MNNPDTVEIVCAQCAQINRVAYQRLGDSPSCGQCSKPLFSGQPAAVEGDAGLQRHIQRNQLPVLVDFWADWCGPCKVMAPHFAAAAAGLEPEVRLLKCDTEQAQAMAASLGIRSIPTLILFSEGQEVARKSGAMESQVIQAWTRHHLERLVQG